MWNCRIIVWLIVVNYYWFRIELLLVRMLVINRFINWLMLGIRPVHFPDRRLLVAGTVVVVMRRRRRLRIGLRRRGHLLRLVARRILGCSYRFIRHVTGHFMLLIMLLIFIRIFIDRRLAQGERRIAIRIRTIRKRIRIVRKCIELDEMITYLLFNWLIFTNSLWNDRRLPILVVLGDQCGGGDGVRRRWRMVRRIVAGHLFDRLLGQRNDILLLARSRILQNGRVLLSRRPHGLLWNRRRLRHHLDRILDRHVRIHLVRHHVVRYGGGRTDRGRYRGWWTLLVGHSIRRLHLRLRTGGQLHDLWPVHAMRIECGRLLMERGEEKREILKINKHAANRSELFAITGHSP